MSAYLDYILVDYSLGKLDSVENYAMASVLIQ